VTSTSPRSVRATGQIPVPDTGCVELDRNYAAKLKVMPWHFEQKSTAHGVVKFALRSKSHTKLLLKIVAARSAICCGPFALNA
jgi:hypothetical protein